MLTRCLLHNGYLSCYRILHPTKTYSKIISSVPFLQVKFYSSPEHKQHKTQESSLLKLINTIPEPFCSYVKLVRLHQPIGIFLVYWPSAWSIGLATLPGEIPDLKLLMLFAIGSVMARGAGCIINDIWDKPFDKKVERTKSRPLAAGSVSLEEAIVLMSAHLGIGLMVLLQLNWSSVVLGVCVVPMIAIYPAFKRFTYWPQLFLGLTFNWGVLIGWAAITDSLDITPILPLYCASVSWTLIYDTIYALQDKKDDLIAGVKSTAIKFGNNVKTWLLGFSSLTCTGLIFSGIMCQQTWPYYASVCLSTLHILSQIGLLNVNCSDDCASKFRSNARLGLLIFAGIIAGTLLKEKSPPIITTF